MKLKTFVLTASALVTLAVGGVIKMKNRVDRTLRVAFPVALPATAYEPTSIGLGYQYIFLENIYSTLIEIAADGSIGSGVAEKADWIDEELRLKIREGLRTQSGNTITADDVVFSLKRLLVLSGNTHGNFKDIVCPGIDLNSVEDPCAGIRREGSFVFLNARGKKSFLLPMLGAIDFAIIPKASVDAKSLKIVNMAETSGPYYVANDDGHGHIELRLNPYHYHAAPNVPEKIVLVPTNSKIQGDSIQKLLDHQVDHLTTIDAAKADELIGFAEKNPEFERHVTMKIRSMVVVFTERGQKELSPAERRYIGQKLGLAFDEIYKGIHGIEPRHEFFPTMSEGGLTPEQEKELKIVRAKGLQAPQKSFRIGLIKRGPLEVWAGPINKQIPQAECYIETGAPDLKRDLKPEDTPHAFIASTDTGFMEDISLISYSLNAGLLGLKKSERTKWLQDYMSTDDKPKRIKKLKALHFNALASPTIVPLMGTPYAALVRKPWHMELSELFANNQLWRIRLR